MFFLVVQSFSKIVKSYCAKEYNVKRKDFGLENRLVRERDVNIYIGVF